MKEKAFSSHSGIYVQHMISSQKHNMPVQHYHQSYEIYLQLSGKRYIFFDNMYYLLEKGDMAIFKPYQLHYAQSRDCEEYERYVLNFTMESFDRILTSDEIMMLSQKLSSAVVRLNDEQVQLMLDLYHTVEHFSKKGGFLSEKLTQCAVIELIASAIESIEENNPSNGRKIASQIVDTMKYINENYQKNLTLDEISENIHMSKFCLCRNFRRDIGTTILEYLTNVRLMRVCSLLSSENDSIEEISQQTGFSSAVALARTFKKVYGISPREYRKKNRLP